jgi:hypothetical protein
MNAKRWILFFSAAALAALLILPAAASAKGPRGCGDWNCGQGKSCQSNRWHKQDRRPASVYPPPYGAHAIRGYAPPHRVVESPRNRGFVYRDSFR